MANQLINRLTQLADSINGQRDSIDRDLTNLTSEVNRLTTEIARVNQQIQATELGNIQASDLRDVRDRLTDELSNIIDVNVIEKENGATVVSMGSMMLVDGSYSLEISAGAEYQGQQVTHYLVWKGTNVKLRNLNGQLAGLVETRDEVIPRYLDQLNEMARLFIEQVNTLHRSGYGLNGTTNVDFFDPNYTDAATIRLNSEIVQDINRIAASESPDGDNIIALQMADMRNIRLLANQTMTINDFYNGLVGNLGVEMRETTSFASNYELLVQQVDGQRQSVQGVSLDEEMANMVKFQHAYDAAARVITVMDQALDTIISEMVLLAR